MQEENYAQTQPAMADEFGRRDRFRTSRSFASRPRPRPRPMRRSRPRWGAARVIEQADERMPETGSEYVRWVQSALNDILNLRLPVDGLMNRETRSAVRSFQEKKGLPADGIVGPDTERALIAARAP